MNETTVIEQVISLFMVIIVGVFASKKKVITEEINKGLTAILLKITLPMLIISSFNFSSGDGASDNIAKAFIYSFAGFIITVMVSYLFLLPIEGNKKNVLQFANTFSNCGFMGFAIMRSIYGEEGVVYTAIFNMFFTTFLWTYGVMLFTKKISLKEAKKVLINPGIIGVYIGIFLMVFKVEIHPVALRSIKMIGEMTTPLSMLIIGYILSTVSLKSLINDWTIYYGALLKLVVIPGVLYAVALLIKDTSKVANTIILLQAMPVAAMTTIFAESFNKEKEYAAIIFFLTTILSIITFPVVVKFIL